MSSASLAENRLLVEELPRRDLGSLWISLAVLRMSERISAKSSSCLLCELSCCLHVQTRRAAQRVGIGQRTEAKAKIHTHVKNKWETVITQGKHGSIRLTVYQMAALSSSDMSRRAVTLIKVTSSSKHTFLESAPLHNGVGALARREGGDGGCFSSIIIKLGTQGVSGY